MTKYTPIIGTLGYVLSADKQKVLMMNRNKKDKDDHKGKYNGLGGKTHSNEDIATSMKREILEEAGIEVIKMSMKGTINWTGFGNNSENWLGFIFLITQWKGDVKDSCEEGDLEWIDKNDILNLPLWEGDKHFLPYVFSEDQEPFHMYMPYEGNKMISYQISK